MAEHIVAKKIYYGIFGALIILTGLTVLVAQFDLGVFNLAVALSIAFVKALLVLLYFMHLRYSSRLSWLFAGSGFFFLAILLALTLSDVVSRSWQYRPEGSGISSGSPDLGIPSEPVEGSADDRPTGDH